MKTIFEWVYGLWFLAVFAAAALLTTAVIAVLPGQDKRRLIVRRGAQMVFHFSGSWPKIHGLSNLPPGASVVVANHASYLDGILLTAVLPPRFQFVIKREITRIPGVHFFLRRIGAQFVERFDVKKGATDARKIMQTAIGGGSLAFFPEGTFRREAGLRRFHNGAFTIAARYQMPIVPVTIKGTRAMLPAQEWLPKPARLEIVIHKPLAVSESIHPVHARDTSRQMILDELAEPNLHPTVTGI